MMITTQNPFTGESLSTYQEHSIGELGKLLEHSTRAFLSWRELTPNERCAFLPTLKSLLESKARHFAELITLEMGKPLSQSMAELQKVGTLCDYYSEYLPHILSPEAIATEASNSYIRYDPLGLILGIMPWNFPFWQVFRFAIPTLLGGNAVILKHAPNTSGCSLAIESLFKDAGLPHGLFQSVLIAQEHVAERVEYLLGHQSIQAVSFTGSASAGKSVASLAASHLKKSVLELGGSDPYLILEDADLELAAEACVRSRLQNCGQSCIAAKRFLVVKKVRKDFESLIIEKVKSIRIASPMEPDTEVGPLARRDLRDKLKLQIRQSLEKNATLLFETPSLPEKGFFHPIVVLSDIAPGMAAFEEETFGPLFAIVPVKHDSEAIELANQTPYGLGCAVFSEDPMRFNTLASKLDAGNCFFNAMVRSDPRLPFGGVKHSGYGRELSSFGVREFVNIKTVYIK